MKITKINNYNNFKSDKKLKRHNPINIPKLSGELALAGMGATVISGVLHKPKLHLASTILTGVAALAHVLSIRNYSNKKEI